MPRVSVLHREGKLGLGSAYLTGFDWGLARGYEWLIEMDADFSHDPKYLPRLLEAASGEIDLAIGSRYVQGVNVINWPMSRLLLSWYANKYAHWVTGLPLKDGIHVPDRDGLPGVEEGIPARRSAHRVHRPGGRSEQDVRRDHA